MILLLESTNRLPCNSIVVQGVQKSNWRIYCDKADHYAKPRVHKILSATCILLPHIFFTSTEAFLLLGNYSKRLTAKHAQNRTCGIIVQIKYWNFSNGKFLDTLRTISWFHETLCALTKSTSMKNTSLSITSENP